MSPLAAIEAAGGTGEVIVHISPSARKPKVAQATTGEDEAVAKMEKAANSKELAAFAFDQTNCTGEHIVRCWNDDARFAHRKTGEVVSISVKK